MITTDKSAYRSVDRHSVERIYIRAKQLFDTQAVSLAEKGMRVARAQNPTLLRTLDACAEVMDTIEDEQRGRTRRSTKDANRAKSHEASMFREAYRLADEGNADMVFAFIYTAAAEYAGIIEQGARR